MDENTSAAAMSVPWSEIITAAVTLLCVLLFHLFAKRRDRLNRPSKRISVRTTYCDDLIAPIASLISDDLQLNAGNKKLQQPALVLFYIECSGNESCENVHMKISCGGADCVEKWNFYVDQDLVCKRLTSEETDDGQVEWMWSFLNPGDTLELAVVVSPCANASQINLEIDAKDAKIVRGRVIKDCTPCGV